MSHPHIEALIFSEAPLAADQQAELQGHLAQCELCAALYEGWSGVSAPMTARRLVPPAPGFVVRWNRRLSLEHARRARRQSWLVLGLIGLAVLVVLAVMGLQARQVYDSPAALMVEAGARAGDVYSAISVVVEVLESLSRAAPGVFLAGLGATMAVLSLVSLLWLVSMSQFVLQRRVIKW